jgi:hypothetical protein
VVTRAHGRGSATHGVDEVKRGARRRGDNQRRSDRPGRKGRAFKGAWLHQVWLVHSIDVSHALRQVGPMPVSAPLTGGPSD